MERDELLQNLMLLATERQDGWWQVEVPGKEIGLLLKVHRVPKVGWVLDELSSYNA